MPFSDPEKQKQYDREKYQRNKESIKARVKAHREDNIDRIRANDRARSKEISDNPGSEKWLKRKATKKKYHAQNLHKWNGYNSSYRARKLGLFVENVCKWKLFDTYKGVCQICGQDINPFIEDFYSPEYLSIDHCIPLSRGGLHDYNNCKPTHLGCNKRKFISILNNDAV